MSDRGAALARYYDLDLRDEPGDLELYRAMARRVDGPILELAVGSGRIAVPLAQEGHEVVGVDSDPAMLERARARWEAAQPAAGSLELVDGDLLDVDLGDRFGLVILALDSLTLLGTAERQRKALRSVARHLRSDGRAVVDAWIPAAHDLALYDGRVVLEWVRDDPEAGERVSKSSSAAYDAATGVVELTSFFDAWPADGGPARRVDRVDTLRLVSADELVSYASEAGLAVETLGGDHELTPFGPGAERAVVVAARA